MPYVELSRNAKSDRISALNTRIGATANLKIYEGAPPLTPDVAPAGALLATLPCSATFGALVIGVTVLEVISGGTGFTSQPTIAITGGGGGGATATAVVVAGVIVGAIVTAFGSGFTSVPTVAVTGGGGTGASLRAEINPVLTANAITTTNASATGVAGMARIETSAGAGVVDMDMTAPGGAGSVIINTTSIAAGGPVQVTSLQIGEQ